MLKYKDLHDRPKELLAATGLKPDETTALLEAFAQAYVERYPSHLTMEGRPRQRGKGGGNKGHLAELEDKLLFILVYQKTYPLQTMLGLQFGVSQGRVNIWVHRLLPILQRALALLSMTPEREGAAVAHSQEATEGGADLVIDGTERRRQRPQDKQRQKEQYSGKKSPQRQKSGLGQPAQPESRVFKRHRSGEKA
jgi:Helix-turn-helix of DDE superfamily endonuclease